MYRSAASSVALVQSTGIEPITKTFPRKEAPAKSCGLAILIAPSELQTQDLRLTWMASAPVVSSADARGHVPACGRAENLGDFPDADCFVASVGS